MPAPKAEEPTASAVPSEGAVGAVALVLRTTIYPVGAGEGTVKEPLNEVAVTLENARAEGCATGVSHPVAAAISNCICAMYEVRVPSKDIDAGFGLVLSL